MNRRNVCVALIMGFITASAPRAFAGVGAHVEAVIHQTKEASEEGAKQDAHPLIAHLRGALMHANEAVHEKAATQEKEAYNNLRKARPRLEQAIAQARWGHLEAATHHVEDALKDLETAGK